MTFIKREYEEYFKKQSSFSLSDFQLEFKLSYYEASLVVEAYGTKLKYQGEFIYTFVESEETDKKEVDDFDPMDLDFLDAMTGFNFIRKKSTDNETVKAAMRNYIKNFPNYSSETQTFSTNFNIRYPNGTEFVLKYSDTDRLLFSDNGLLKACVVDMYSSNGIKSDNIDKELVDMLRYYDLKCEGDEVVHKIAGSFDEEDLNEEVFFLVRAFDEILRQVTAKINGEKQSNE